MVIKKKRATLPRRLSPLIGRWVAADQWATSVELIISSSEGKVRVRAVTPADAEEAEVMNLKTAGDTITFAAYWSSGQLTKYRLRAIGDEIEAVFTYIDTCTFVKSASKK
jgi:hypothetical protein